MPTETPVLSAVLTEAQARGWIGKAPIGDTIAHARGFAACVAEPPALFADLGSGGGVPGLVLALDWTDAAAVLVEASATRAAFLQESVERLGLESRVTVLSGRAEAVVRERDLRGRCDLVVARGFAVPPVVAECASPLLRVGGLLVVSEPPAYLLDDSQPRWPAEPLAALGLALESAPRSPYSYQVLRQESPCPDRYPRRPGIPQKRPLF